MGIYTPPLCSNEHPNTHTPIHLHTYIYIYTLWPVVEVFYPSLHTPTHINYMDYTGMILYCILYLLRVLSQITTFTLTYFDLKSCKRSIYATSFKNCADVVKYAVIYSCLFSFNNCFISSVLNC